MSLQLRDYLVLDNNSGTLSIGFVVGVPYESFPIVDQNWGGGPIYKLGVCYLSRSF